VKVKTIAGFLLFTLLFIGPALAAEPWEAAYGKLLKSYVRGDGVDYAAWNANASDKAALKSIVDQIAARGPSNESRDVALAYYINAYNAWILHLVLESYPLKSVREIAPLFGVFTGDRIVVNGKQMSLNHLEKQIIIKQFKEPRIHFAINCASRSCPPLVNVPFTAGELNAQLDKVTRNFAPSPHAARMDPSGKRILLSKIFDWYADDFKPAGGPVPFLNRYLKSPLPKAASVGYQNYDWSLNTPNP
jgi:hypothetical protein